MRFSFISISLGIISVFLYFPFLVGLSSQAGGFLPSLIFRTRGIHFLIMFLPQILLISWLLIVANFESFSKRRFWLTMLFGLLFSFLLEMFSMLYILLPNFAENLLRIFANRADIGHAIEDIKYAKRIEQYIGNLWC